MDNDNNQQNGGLGGFMDKAKDAVQEGQEKMKDMGENMGQKMGEMGDKANEMKENLTGGSDKRDDE